MIKTIVFMLLKPDQPKF